MSATPRLYVTDALAEGAQLTLAEQPSHYLRNVMRLKEGARILVFNGRDGEWETTLITPSKKQTMLQCGVQQKPQRDSLPVTVCFAPVKGGRVEGMIEKATELGATRIIPVATNRTVVKHLNVERLALIAREAAEQSERLDVPDIAPLTPLKNLLAEWPHDVPLFYGDESGASSQVTLEGTAPAAWGTLTGPEGGFTDEEFAMLAHSKASRGVGLGPRILRADTACTTLLAITAQYWGDWHEAPHFEGENQ